MPELESASESPAAGILTERATQLALLKKNLDLAQKRMKTHADKHRTEREFQVGDSVLLCL
jgi:hypothetical protein